MAQVGRLPVRGELVPGPERLRDRGARRRSAPDQEGAHPPQQGSPDRARPRRPPPLQHAGRRRAPRSRRRRRRMPRSPSPRPPQSTDRPKAPAPAVTAADIRAAHAGRSRASRTRIVLAWGWRRALIAFAAGALSALALAPLDAWPVLFLTFPVLVWLIDGAAAGRLGGVPSAAIAGWWFGFGYFLAGLYWVGYAFLVDAKTFGWLLPFAVIALPAGHGAASPRSAWRWRACCGRAGRRGCIALAVALTAAEWLRGHLFTGFPWNALRLRADRPAGARAGRGADRHLGPHLHRGRGLREPGGAGRRSRRHAAALAAARARRRAARGACGLRRAAARAHADRVRRRRAAADHAAQSASRTRSSTTPPSRR